MDKVPFVLIMGSIKKIGPEYYIEFEARGLKYQQKAGTDEEAARRLLDDVEGKIKKGEMGAIIRDADIDIFLADFIQFAAEQHTPKTVKRFETLIAHFYDFLREEYRVVLKLSQVTPVILEQYKLYLSRKTRIPARPANKEKVINLSFFLLYEVFQFAIKLGYLNDNPTLHIRLSKVPIGRRPLGLSEEERQRFFQGNESVRVKALLNALQEQAHGTEALCLQFQELLYNCGLKNQPTLSCLRDTFAIDLLNKGVGIGTLYKYIGLSDIAQAMIYAPFIPDKQKELYEGINPRL